MTVPTRTVHETVELLDDINASSGKYVTILIVKTKKTVEVSQVTFCLKVKRNKVTISSLL